MPCGNPFERWPQRGLEEREVLRSRRRLSADGVTGGPGRGVRAARSGSLHAVAAAIGQAGGSWDTVV